MVVPRRDLRTYVSLAVDARPTHGACRPPLHVFVVVSSREANYVRFRFNPEVSLPKFLHTGKTALQQNRI